MHSIRALFESTFAAAAFAEAGEHATARAMVRTPARSAHRPGRIGVWIETLRSGFAAVAFAEENMPETAVALVGGQTTTAAPQPTLDEFMRQVGLSGVPAFYGVARV